MPEPVTFPVYTTIYTSVVTMAAPIYLARGLVQNKYLWNRADRFGRRDLGFGSKNRPRLWVHALSLGEVVASSGLVDRLLEQDVEVCLSTATRAGFEVAQTRFPQLPRFSGPLDLPSAVKRTVDQVRPDLFLLMETDIWPNLLACLHNRNVPAVLVNARVSPRSLAGYRKIKGFWGRVLGLFSHICCQTEPDRDRLLALGAPSSRTTITGNLKFDQPAPMTSHPERPALLDETGLPDRRWLVAGSTHPGEEEILLDIFQELKTSHSDLGLLIAPRNKRRFETVWKLITAASPAAARRTGPRPGPDTRIYLLDTHGELDRFYELGDVVFVGKSMPLPGERGGHNLLEPARRGKPVLFGPQMHNFPEIARLLRESGGGMQVQDKAELQQTVRDLLDNEELRKETGRKARLATEKHRGALDRTLEVIDSLIRE